MDTFTLFHTAVSVVAIVAGAVAVAGILRNHVVPFWTNLFLLTAVVTSVTGFFFPFRGLTPAQIVGILALAILIVVLLALYRFHLAKFWRWLYAAGMVASLYLLVFVGIVQAFQKIAFLNGLAPTGTEPAFVAAQGAALLLFVATGIAAARRYRPETVCA
jgi:hypothetical protein